MKRHIASLVVGIAAAFAAIGSASAHDGGQRCSWPEPVVDANAAPVPHFRFEDIDSHWTLARVFARLGPARREAGELTYEWVDDEGNVFVAAAASRCGIVRRASFADRGRPSS
jgi:hypothetical protein